MLGPSAVVPVLAASMHHGSITLWAQFQVPREAFVMGVSPSVVLCAAGHLFHPAARVPRPLLGVAAAAGVWWCVVRLAFSAGRSSKLKTIRGLPAAVVWRACCSVLSSLCDACCRGPRAPHSPRLARAARQALPPESLGARHSGVIFFCPWRAHTVGCSSLSRLPPLGQEGLLPFDTTERVGGWLVGTGGVCPLGGV